MAIKSAKRSGIRDIHRYRGILKDDTQRTDKSRDEMRIKHLSEKYA